MENGFMNGMQVVFSFDENKIKTRGLKKEDIYYNITKNYLNIGLHCVSSSDILAFEDDSTKDNYGKIWAILVSLIECDWFTETVSRCEFIENGKSEDIYVQLPKLKRRLAGEIINDKRRKKKSRPESGKLKVRLSFDEEEIKRCGMDYKKVCDSLKRRFYAAGIKCVSDDKIFEFIDSGNKNDWGNMWWIILDLLDSEWFVKCATSCVFIENGMEEDVLSQLPWLQEIMME